MLFYVTHFDDIYEKKNFFSLRLSLTVSWNKQIREGSFDLRIYEHTERKFFWDLVPQNCSFRLSLGHKSY